MYVESDLYKCLDIPRLKVCITHMYVFINVCNTIDFSTHIRVVILQQDKRFHLQYYCDLHVI